MLPLFATGQFRFLNTEQFGTIRAMQTPWASLSYLLWNLQPPDRVKVEDAYFKAG